MTAQRILLAAVVASLVACATDSPPPTQPAVADRVVIGSSERFTQQGIAESIDTLLRAANGGYTRAQLRAATLYFSGRGVPQSHRHAFFYYQLAAQQGNAAAAHKLGIMYSVGMGTPRHCGESVRWLMQASNGGEDKARAHLAWMLATCPEAEHRNGVLAVKIAEQLVGESKHEDAEHLDTLAAAYAEVGAFRRAAQTALEAVKLAQASGRKALASLFLKRARLYEAGKPYRNIHYKRHVVHIKPVPTPG
jgi:uncharacterized protein